METRQAPRTFHHYWERAVAENPEGTFLVFEDGDGQLARFTYGDFNQHVDAAAKRLYEYGVRPGSAVHLCLMNCPAFVLTWLAASRLGAWIIPADPASVRQDLERQFQLTSPAVGIYSTARASVYEEAARVAPRMRTISVTEGADDTQPGSALLADGEGPRQMVEPQTRLAVMFTSGTTSSPKGVVLTQANYGTIAETMASIIGLSAEDRWIVSLPLFHGNAQYYCFSTAIFAKASVGLTARFSASTWLRSAKKLQATHASLFAAPIRMILDRTPEDSDPVRLKHVWYAQNLTPAEVERFSALVGVTPRQIYGMTETCSVVTADMGETPTPGLIGKVLPGREVRVVNEVTHEPSGLGEPGLLLLAGERGRDIFEGYLDAPEITEAAFIRAEGREWFRTGDLVRMQADGNLSFVGRSDDIIKVAGENVSILEIEARLAQAPGVREIVVVANPDPIRDVVPIAYVVPDSHATSDAEREVLVESLKNYAKQMLTPAARPREWRFVEDLPRTSVGKIRRFMLADSGGEEE